MRPIYILLYKIGPISYLPNGPAQAQNFYGAISPTHRRSKYAKMNLQLKSGWYGVVWKSGRRPVNTLSFQHLSRYLENLGFADPYRVSRRFWIRYWAIFPIQNLPAHLVSLGPLFALFVAWSLESYRLINWSGKLNRVMENPVEISEAMKDFYQCNAVILRLVKI